MFDDTLKKFDGVRFFLSCITGTKTNRKGSTEIRHGIAYFIVFRQTEMTTVEKFFAAFHDSNLESRITKLSLKRDVEDREEQLENKLSQVVKVNTLYTILFLTLDGLVDVIINLFRIV